MPSRGQGAVFLCYRRDDDDHARLFELTLRTLVNKTGVIFFDQTQPLGRSIPEKIKHGLEACRLMIVLIGPTWNAKDAQGRGRLHDAKDWVRLEIEAFLRRAKSEEKLKIISVRIDGAEEPDKSQLPPELHELLVWEFIPLDLRNSHDGRWQQLRAAIFEAMGPPPWKQFLTEVFLPWRNGRSV